MRRYAPLLLVLLLAAFLRLFMLPTLPPGLNFDEAGNGVAALDILHGQPRLWWRIGGGKEPLWPYLVAITTTLWGYRPLALRLPAAIAGILAVAAARPLVLALFREHPHRHRLALLTMLGLATSAWHVHFSRLGFRAILLPLLATLAFYFLWRSLNREQPPALPSALLLALAIYAYLAARLLPLVALLFLGLYSLRRRNPPFSGSVQKSGTNPPALPLLMRLLAWLLLFLAPLAAYFLLHPADFMARSAAVSIFNPAQHGGDLPGTAWRTLSLTMGTFLGLAGDQNPLVNLPGQSALSLLLVPFFILGLLVALYKARRAGPELFLLCWWAVMLLPALLAPEGAPHHLRLIGAIVPTYALVGLGMVTAARLWGSVAWLAPLLLLLVGGQTCLNYFVRWPQSADFTLPFDLYAVRLAGDIGQAPPQAAYLLPVDIRAGAEARHYTLDYLLAARPNPAYTYLPVDEHQAQERLAQAAAGKERLRVVRWTQDKHHQADAREIVTFLLMTQAQLVDRATFPVYDIETYALDPAATYRLPPIEQPVQATFDDRLRLEALYLPPSWAGQWLPVALTLVPMAPMETDYKASVRLVDPTGGQRLAQKDRLLLHPYHQGTSLWPPEPVNEYYLLPVPPQTPPGLYTVTLVLYHPDSQAPLVTAAGQAELPLGQVRLNQKQ